MIRYLPFTRVEEKYTDPNQYPNRYSYSVENNPITDLTKNMGKECSDEQIYGIPTQNLTLERIRR